MKLSTFQLTRYFILFTVAILVLFGIGSLLRISGNPDRTALYTFYALLMFGDAAVMAFCLFLLDKRNKYAYPLSVVVLALNVFATIFDQFGLVDLLFLLLILVALVSLIMARKEFLPA